MVVSLIILALWNIRICYGSVNVEIDQNLLILLETLINSFTNLPTLSFKDTVLWSYLQKKKKKLFQPIILQAHPGHCLLVHVHVCVDQHVVLLL